MAWSGTCSSCTDTSLNSFRSHKMIIRFTTRGWEFKQCDMMHVTNETVCCFALIFTMYEIPMRKTSLWNAVYLTHIQSPNSSFAMAQQPLVGQGLLIIQPSRSHSVRQRSLLDKCSAHRRDLYLTIGNTHKRQTRMPLRDSNPQFQQVNSYKSTP